MTNDRLVQLVEKLLKRTAEGTVEWKESYSGGIYEVDLGNYLVLISTEFNPEYNSDDIVIKLKSNSDQILETFSDVDIKDDLEQSYKKMYSLYKGARRAALGTDKAIDNILDILDNN